MYNSAELAPNDPAAAEQGAALAGTYLTFELAGQVLGVAVSHVREILDEVTIRLLPNAPHDIEGVIDIRGESIPVLDMGSRLGLPRSDDGEDTRIIVFEVQSGDTVCPVGVLADRVRDVTEVSPEHIEAPPNMTGAAWTAETLRGFARQGDVLILLIDVTQVLGGQQDQFLTSMAM